MPTVIRSVDRSALKPKDLPNGKLIQAYKTTYGRMLHGRIEDALDSSLLARVKGKISLIMTSPPFPLVRKKRYGNETGEAYIEWLEALASPLADLLTPDGSIVIEIGNAWEEGAPIMSTLPLEALLAHDQRTKWAYIFGAICPAKGKAAGLVMPWCNTEAMAEHLKEISLAVDPGCHAVLMLDQAGWHGSARLPVPANITLLPLPPRSPS